MINIRWKEIGLVPKLIIGLMAGILIGAFLPEFTIRILVTLSSLFASLLQFTIPLMILAFVISGISDLTHHAGKLLGITTLVAYSSTILAGFIAYFTATSLFPRILQLNQNIAPGSSESGTLSPLFSIELSPVLSVTSAVVLAFMLGLGIAWLKSTNQGENLYRIAGEFQQIIVKVLEKVIIPLLPLYIAGTFANITYAGQMLSILSLLWKVFLTAILLHFAYLTLMFITAGLIGKKNPVRLMKNQIPAYLTAVGTQSSAATIPVNVACAEKNGVSRQIREFVVPLCATIHLAGSMISLVCFITALMYIHHQQLTLALFLPFLFTLGIAMVAAPGAPGGAVMSALPFLPMLGIGTESILTSLLVTLYLTQDSFGTAANVSGDNAIAVIIDSINHKLSH